MAKTQDWSVARRFSRVASEAFDYPRDREFTIRWTELLSHISRPRSDDDHVKRYRGSAKDGRLLSEQTFDGWVKRHFENHVIVEFQTPHGIFDQTFGIEDFEGQHLPIMGTAVRLVSHLLTAPDLESDPWEDGGDDDPVRELKLQPGQTGEYRLGD